MRWEERLMIVCRAGEDTTGERPGPVIRTGETGGRETAWPDLLQAGADQRETPREKRPTPGPAGRGARVENRPAREIGGLETLRLLRRHQQSPAPGETEQVSRIRAYITQKRERPSSAHNYIVLHKIL